VGTELVKFTMQNGYGAVTFTNGGYEFGDLSVF
jgi:hypothetical protein